MVQYEENAFPLTTAQRGIWATQKITPHANLNIAEAVEISGSVDPNLFRRSLHQVVSEAEELRTGIVERDGRPQQVSRPVYHGDFPCLDMSSEADPRKAAFAWMTHELSRPVDLARDPLWVSALLKVGAGTYFWYQRAHHIVFDGYGGGLTARRLADVYTAYAQGVEPEPNCFCTVKEMVAAEAAYRSSERWKRDREYWHQQLAYLPAPVTLSRSRRRYGLSGKLRRSVGHFAPEMARRLTDLGRTAEASLPQALIALIIAYYQRATGADDFVVGMPVSGRVKSELRRSLSVSANVVPIRIRFTANITAFELIREVSQVVRQALRHQQYRYEDLRRDLGLLGQNQNLAWLGVNIEPFDYCLSFNGAAGTSHNLSNSSAEDLMIFVYDRGTDTGLRFDLDANPALYGEVELDEHRRRLGLLADEVLAHPDAPLRRLDVLGEEERHRLLVVWNRTQGPVPETCVPALVARWAAATPEAPAVVFEERVLTYRELHERSLEQARRLIGLGVRPGDIVAVALPRSERLLIALLAIMRAGAAYLPLDMDSPMERTAFVLEDASPVAIIADDALHSRFAGCDAALLSLTEVREIPAEGAAEPDLSRPEGIVYVLYTSGSTGRPKGVQVTHRNLANFLRAMQLELQPKASDRYLSVTTLIFDIAGLELYLPLTAGAQVILAGGGVAHHPLLLARLIRRSGATHMQATPSLWRILLSSSEATLENIHVLVGGEALSAELASRLQALAARVTQFYGPTETTIWSTVSHLDAAGATAPPIGRPLLNTLLYVLREDRQPVMTGAVGELYIGGEGVARGYLNRPELTAERFLPDPFAGNGGRMYRTGDLVRWNDEGQLDFLGRIDDQVKINGHRVELGEIESHLLRNPAVSQAAVAAHRSQDGTITLAGYVVAAPGAEAEADPEALRACLSTQLPSFIVPRRIMVLNALPLTPTGKLDRKALPAPERATRALSAPAVTPTEKKLAALWQEILRVDAVGLHDNFFELGGDSLTAAELSAIFPSQFGTELPLGSVFEAPTIADLAARVEQLVSGSADPLGVVLPLRMGKASEQRPLFCIHPIAGLSFSFSGLLRHMNPDMPVYGLQSRGLSDGERLPGSIEEIAADYLEQVRRLQPEGPYRLLGRSLGGLIAHSMAEQMLARNLRVEMLAMIDTYLFTSVERARPLTEADEVRAVLRFLDIVMRPEEMPSTMEQLAETLRRIYGQRTIPVAEEILRSHPQFIQHVFAVMLNNMQLARRHVPKRVEVDLLYFSATGGDLPVILGHSPSAWRAFIGGKVDVHELDCGHESVLDPVPAGQIGSILQRRLNAIDERRTEEEWSAA
jgi:enterobactin synthetase component F